MAKLTISKMAAKIQDGHQNQHVRQNSAKSKTVKIKNKMTTKKNKMATKIQGVHSTETKNFKLNFFEFFSGFVIISHVQENKNRPKMLVPHHVVLV